MKYKKYEKYTRQTYYLKFNKGIIVSETTVDNYYGVMSVLDSGDYVEDKTVEVFLLQIPLKYKLVETIYITASERLSTGYKLNKLDDCYELKFYNHNYAMHKIFDLLEKSKLMQTKKIISKPKWKYKNDFFDEIELFPYYINPKGLWQCSYDIVMELIELGLKFLYRIFKLLKNKHKKGEMKNV